MIRHTILITGAAGYIGGMLVRKLAAREDVERIIGLDKEPLPDFIAGVEKLQYLQMNTVEEWESQVRSYKPDMVIHTAWQIREMYGQQDLEWHWNIDGSDRVFAFALNEPGVRSLVHFSTVASYGAFEDNTLEHRFTEEEPFRKSAYLYAEEKRVAEEHLAERFLKRSNQDVAVSIVRPAAITGPRGRFMRIRFGLQAALSGSLKNQRSFLYDLISLMVAWVPVTPKWLRQYVHEDDVVDIVELLAFSAPPGAYEAFNLAPPGPAVLGSDMAQAVGKRMLPIYPWMARLAFFWFWHLTRGRVPTSPGSWRGYSYPIGVDGSKLTRLHGYQYRASSYDAFYYTSGRYEDSVPELERRTKL